MPGETIEVRIPFPPSDANAAVTLQQGLAGDESTPVDLVRDEITRTWRAQVQAGTTGQTILTARMPREDLDPIFAQAMVDVVPDTREEQSTAAGHALMAELAQLGGGQVLGDDPIQSSRGMGPMVAHGFDRSATHI